MGVSVKGKPTASKAVTGSSNLSAPANYILWDSVKVTHRTLTATFWVRIPIPLPNIINGGAIMTKKQKLIIEKYVRDLNSNLDRYGHDPEVVHQNADTILLLALEELGFSELSDAYNNCREKARNWWYS